MPFRYLRDPVFVFCLALYAVNRWVLKPYLPNMFSQCYLNDFICIPFWVPIMLFGMRKTGLRRDDAPPKSYEILIPLILWSIVFELILPNWGPLRGLAFADHLDILFYTLGALAAALVWRRIYAVQQPV